MDTPGNLLKAEREKQKKSLEDIEKVLKINIAYLNAIEKDNYGLLPADVFTKSYLRSYSEMLGLESDHILSLYNKQFSASPAMEPEQPPKKPLLKKLPAFKFNYIYIMAICIGLVAVSLTLYAKHGNKKPVTVTANKVTTNEVKTNEIEAPGTAKTTVPEKDLLLKIAASDLTWVSIKIDSAKAMEHLLRTGESITFQAHEKFVLKIGNAGGTKLIFNGRDVGPLGPDGQVVDIVLP